MPQLLADFDLPGDPDDAGIVETVGEESDSAYNSLARACNQVTAVTFGDLAKLHIKDDKFQKENKTYELQDANIIQCGAPRILRQELEEE